jgi:hypothetical protein
MLINVCPNAKDLQRFIFTFCGHATASYKAAIALLQQALSGNAAAAAPAFLSCETKNLKNIKSI